MSYKLILPAVLLNLAVTGAAFADTMSEADIRSDIAGRTVYLAAPLGGEFPLNYHTSGVVDGDGKALGLGKWVQPSDKGKWWIKDDQLCQQFETWYKGAPMCFTLTRTGPKTLNWLRDNGEKGTARIGD